MQQVAEDQWLTADEVMELLGIKANTFYNLRKAGLIVPANENPLIHRQRGLLFSKAALLRLKAQMQAEREALREAARRARQQD